MPSLMRFVVPLCVGVAMALVAAPVVAQTDPLSAAAAASKQTQKPMFVLLTRSTCSVCTSVKNRLASDASLKPLLANFVTVEVDTDGAQATALQQKYTFEGSALPGILIVRVDGVSVVSQYSGGLSGDALPNLLATSLVKAGRALTPKQMAELGKALAVAKEAVAAGDDATAAAALAKVLGSGSFTEEAQAADALGKEIEARGQEALTKAEASLDATDTALEGAVALLEVKRVYGTAFPAIKQASGKAVTEAKKKKELRTTLQLAETLDKAKAQAAKQPEAAKKALRRLIDEHQGEPIATLAEAALAELDAPSAEKSSAQ